MLDSTWIKKNGYIINSIAQEMGFILAVSLKEMNSMNIDSGLEGDCNRKNYLNTLNMQNKNLVYGKQIHESNLAIINNNKNDQFNNADKPYINTYMFPDTDALITDDPDICLGVFTADCLSIAIIDISKNITALVHSGWRSSAKKILTKTINNMFNMGSKINNIYIFFGPSNQSCCYKVGDELYNFFEKKFFNRKQDDIYFDNQAFNIDLLNALEFKKNQIFENPYCTSCNNDILYSYRNEPGKAGRNMTVLCKK